jgi:superfamily II DNA or RNA helicase
MARTTKNLGDSFEELAITYFKTDPKFQNIKNIWHQKEIPFSVLTRIGIPTNDIGIDILLESEEGDLYPVQCKYHSDPDRAVGWKEASTFIGILNSNTYFKAGYLCSNAFEVSSNYDKALSGKPIVRILGSIWDSVSLPRTKEQKLTLTPLSPRPHQQRAIDDAKKYFGNEGNTRGKLIFPCGAGKSLTGYWITQELGAKSVIVAVPSLALVKQTLEVYLREIAANERTAKWLCVCSDQEIGSTDEVKIHTADLGVPCTTDPTDIRHWLKQESELQKIVFTTYQSGRLVADISHSEGIQFDLGIFDEAHKTVGSTGKLFSYLLFEKNISISKRIFMTATERFYSGTKDDIVSMDDVDVYGEVFTQMTFKEAINLQLLTDYKVITIDVAKKEIADFIRENKLVELDSKWGTETEARSLAAMIALRKAMKALPIRNAVSFHSSIAKAERNSKLQEHITATYGLPPIASYTVSGKMSTGQRDRIISEFAEAKGALVTNARCLTEGVDVPNIDCIVFADPRKSRIDIVQALGRALRRKEGKTWGYIILPVVYDGDTHEIDNDNFNEIVSIVRGLAANDERIIEYFKDKNSLEKVGGSQLSQEQFMFLTDALVESDLTGQLNIKLWEGLSRFNWMTFSDAKKYVAGIRGIKSRSAWENYISLNSVPVNLPKRPDSAYRSDWKGWGDFLGTGVLASWLREYRSYSEAKEFAIKLGLKNQSEWFDYTNNVGIPVDIPKAPHLTYKDKGWKGWGDFLGTGNIANYNRVFWDFETARAYVHSLKISKKDELKELAKKGELPVEIPTNPNRTYANCGWKGWGDWTGTGNVATYNKKYLPYEKALVFIHKLKLRNWAEWRQYKKLNKLPNNIPANPHQVYLSKGWTNMGDWLGSNSQPKVTKAREFKEARDFIRQLNLRTLKEWREYANSPQRPFDIPKSPQTVYANAGFIDLFDWIGISRNRWRSFESARAFVWALNLKNLEEWREYCSSGEKPDDIPSSPNRVYKEYKSAGDWLGTGTVRTDLIAFLTYDESKDHIHKLKLSSQADWTNWKKAGMRPKNIPSDPYKSYKNSGWISWPDFLGYDKKK